MRDQGVDVLLLSVGADLPYLTGYEAMPLERLTMLVVPADGDATLVVPRLEAPRVRRAARRVRAAPVGRDRGPDRDRRRRSSAARPTAGRRRPDVGPLPGRAPGRAARRRGSGAAVDVTGPLRAVKDAAEIDALRRGGRGGRPGRRAAMPARSRSSAAPRPRCTATSAPPARRGPRPGQLRHRRRRAERRQPAPRRRPTG